MTQRPRTPKCGACYGQLHYLGRLGRVDHYRCRDCGLTQGIDAPTIPDDLDPDRGREYETEQS